MSDNMINRPYDKLLMFFSDERSAGTLQVPTLGFEYMAKRGEQK